MGSRVIYDFIIMIFFREQRDKLGWGVAGLTFANIGVNQISAILSMLKSIKDLYIKVSDKCREKQKAKIEDCTPKDCTPKD